MFYKGECRKVKLPFQTSLFSLILGGRLGKNGGATNKITIGKIVAIDIRQESNSKKNFFGAWFKLKLYLINTIMSIKQVAKSHD